MSNPRPVTPRHWGALMLTTVALTHASALPAQTTTDTTVATAAEGGEGGEGGAVAGKTDEQAYLIRLVTVDGHLRAGLEAYRQGFIPEAMALVGHPDAEVMDDLAPQLQAHGAGDLYAPIDALSAAIGQEAPIAAVEAAYHVAQTAIAAALETGEGGVKAQLNAIYDILSAAAEEYEQSLENGKVVDPIAWEEAHGFFIVTADIAQRLSENDPSGGAARALQAITPARDAFVRSGDTPNPIEAALLYGAAAQVEFAALTVR